MNISQLKLLISITFFLALFSSSMASAQTTETSCDPKGSADQCTLVSENCFPCNYGGKMVAMNKASAKSAKQNLRSCRGIKIVVPYRKEPSCDFTGAKCSPEGQCVGY